MLFRSPGNRIAPWGHADNRTEPDLTRSALRKGYGVALLMALVHMLAVGDRFLLSILIGVVLSAMGLDPLNIVQSITRLLRDIWNMGFDAVRWLWQYFLLGAVIVIPIWLILLVVNAPRGK